MSGGNVYVVFAILGILLISLLTVLYNTYYFKKDIEGFQSVEMFQNFDFKPTHNAIQPQVDTYKEDDSLPLIKFRYIDNTPIEKLDIDIASLFYITRLQFYSLSNNDIHQKIADDINKVSMKTKGQFVEGPVYTIIYDDKNNNDLHSDNSMDMDIDMDMDIGTIEKLITIFILYPNYYSDDDGKIHMYADQTGMKNFKSYFDTHSDAKNSAIIYQLNNKNKLFHNLEYSKFDKFKL